MSEPQHYRLFLSLSVPERIKDRLAAVQVELKDKLPEGAVTWTKPEQFHLTLKFLGNVETQKVDALRLQLRSVSEGLSSMKLSAIGAGAFPDLHFPRVIWIGLKDAQGKLAPAQQELENVCLDFMPAQHPQEFHSHITLGRLKRLGRPEAQVLSKSLAGYADEEFGEWTSTEIELMRSELSSAGARHSIVEHFPLFGK